MKSNVENHSCFLVFKWNMYTTDFSRGKFYKVRQFIKL